MNYRYIKYIGVLVIVIMLFPCIIAAQESTGFEDDEDLTNINMYRLPTWGYSTLGLTFSSNGTFYREASGNSFVRHSYANGVVHPAYEHYRESESNILRFDAEVGLLAMYSRIREEQFLFDAPNQRHNIRAGGFNVSGDYSMYTSDNRFFFLSGDTWYQAQWEKDEYIGSRRYRRLSELAEAGLFSGIGFGRVRNVTPVIRALRVRERANALNRGDGIDYPLVDDLARHFARESAYKRVYDRPARHFRSEMFSLLEPATGTLTPYDILYLSDVFHEPLGVRLEGWDIRMGLFLNSMYIFSRSKSDFIEELVSASSSFKITRYMWGPRISASVYKNLSLSHQIGMDARTEYGVAGDESSGGRLHHEQILGFAITPRWLWNVTDRILLQADIPVEYRVVFDDGNRETIREYNPVGTIVYFVEDRLALSGSVQYRNINRDYDAILWEASSTRFNFSIGITYYFIRGMR